MSVQVSRESVEVHIESLIFKEWPRCFVGTMPFMQACNANFAHFVVLTKRSGWWKKKGTYLALLHNWHWKWHCLIVNYARIVHEGFSTKSGEIVQPLQPQMEHRGDLELSQHVYMPLGQMHWGADNSLLRVASVHFTAMLVQCP